VLHSDPTLLLLPLPSRLCAGLQRLTVLLSCNFTTGGLACLTLLTGLQELKVHGCGLTLPDEQGDAVPCIKLHLRKDWLPIEEVRWRFEASTV
jgi:hypothetical protein